MITKSALRRILPIALSILICMAATVNALHNKENFHMDEMFSYAHANSTQGAFLFPEDNSDTVFYDDKKLLNKWWNTERFLQYMSVSPQSRFQYQNIINNLSKDVHPPLFHILLHTISSFFPHTVSKWYAGTINLIAYFFSLILLYKLSRLFFKQRLYAILPVILWGTSNVGIATAIFLRMYALQTLFTLGLTYETLCLLNKRTRYNQRLIAIFLYSTLGLLTQYNSIFFSFIITAVTSFILLTRHHYRLLIKYDLVMLLSIICLFTLFTPTYALFTSERATAGFDILKDFIYSFDSILQIVDHYTKASIQRLLPELIPTLELSNMFIQTALFLCALACTYIGYSGLNTSTKNQTLKKATCLLLGLMSLLTPVISIMMLGVVITINHLNNTKTDLRSRFSNKPFYLIIIFFLTNLMISLIMPNMGKLGQRYYMLLMPIFSLLIIYGIIRLAELLRLKEKNIFIALVTLLTINVITSDFTHRSVFAYKDTKELYQLKKMIKDKPVISIFIRNYYNVISFYEQLYILLNSSAYYATTLKNSTEIQTDTSPQVIKEIITHPDAIVLIHKTPLSFETLTDTELTTTYPQLDNILELIYPDIQISERHYLAYRYKASQKNN